MHARMHAFAFVRSCMYGAVLGVDARVTRVCARSRGHVRVHGYGHGHVRVCMRMRQVRMRVLEKRTVAYQAGTAHIHVPSSCNKMLQYNN